MASGHEYRANRPNTWLHRPMLQSEDSSCQPGAVHTWPFRFSPVTVYFKPSSGTLTDSRYFQELSIILRLVMGEHHEDTELRRRPCGRALLVATPLSVHRSPTSGGSAFRSRRLIWERPWGF